MGNLLNTLAWLVDELTAAGTPLRRGMIVSRAAIQYPVAGDRVSVAVSELGTAELAVK
jgi:2-keto-4-pentenoate hydratase